MIFFKKVDNFQAISFDLDDTLYDNFPIMRKAEAMLLSYMDNQFPLSRGHNLSFWQGIKRQILAQRPEMANDMGALRLQTLIQGFETCGYNSQEASQNAKQCFDFFYVQRSHFQVTPQVSDVLEKLAAKVPLVAITNGNVNLEQVGIAQYFSACFHARLDQPMKPHPKMFELAQQALKLPSEQILHVGDSLEKDIMGAKNAGFGTAWYACDRPMDIRTEKTTVLPDIQLSSLNDLLEVV